MFQILRIYCWTLKLVLILCLKPSTATLNTYSVVLLFVLNKQGTNKAVNLQLYLLKVIVESMAGRPFSLKKDFLGGRKYLRILTMSFNQTTLKSHDATQFTVLEV